MQLQLVMRGFSVNETTSKLEESVAPHSELKKIFKKSKIKGKNIILFLDNPVQVLPAEKALTLDDVEANLKHLRAELHEAKSRNIYLYNLVEEQKRYTYRKMELYRYTQDSI